MSRTTKEQRQLFREQCQHYDWHDDVAAAILADLEDAERERDALLLDHAPIIQAMQYENIKTKLAIAVEALDYLVEVRVITKDQWFDSLMVKLES